VVHVVALVGRGPRLVEVSAPTTEASLQIASTLVRAWHQQQRDDGEAIVLPNVARVKVPAVEIPPSPIAAIGVSTEGRLLGATQTLTDVAGLAQRKSKAEMPWIIGRAVARRVLKESSVVATSEVLGLSGNAAALVEFAAINAWSATERADTRCWGLLPREFQVLRAELPAGRRVIELEPMGAGGGRCGAGRKLEIEVADGRSHYVFVFAPAGIVSVVSQAVAP
jgi:hypothetical protein